MAIQFILQLSNSVYSTFGNYIFDYDQAASLTDKYPNPSLILLDWYYPGNEPAFGYHPDIYPPKSDFGTKEEFTSMVKDMQEIGHFVAPWTLPVWWHQNSPTVLNLSGSQGLEEFVVIDMDSNPVEVSMGPKGYLPSPHHFAVKNKMNDMYQWHQRSFGFDNVYEHWKARYWANFDLNSSEPDPTSYYQGWLQHQKNHSNANLIVQTGYDRQLEFANGFVGSLVRNPDEESRFPHIDPSEWEPWPVSAPLVRGKTLIYQDGNHQTISKEILSFNLAFGCMLNLWPDSKNESNIDSQWWDVMKYFQQEVVAVIGDKQITGYQILEDNVSKTYFGDQVVIRSMDENTGYTHKNHTISGNGAMADLFWGEITAGVFTGYNGQTLAGGDHFMIEKQEENLITVWHPKGSNTNIRILKPWSWSSDNSVSVFAITAGGEVSLSKIIDGRTVDFTMNQYEGGNKVLRFEIRYGGVLSGAEELETSISGLSISVYPNPVTDETVISYTLDQPGYIKICLHDIHGKEIYRIADKNENSGSYNHKLDKSLFPKGIYYLVLETINDRIIKKIIIG